MLNLIKKISLTNKLLTITKMLSIMQTRGLNKKAKIGDECLKNNLFVTAGEVVQDLGVSKPFAYKLVRQMNEELEAKGFITIAGRVSRKYYEEKFYGMSQERGVRVWRHIKMKNVVHGMCHFTTMIGQVRMFGAIFLRERGAWNE
jgi:hypothetical protein